MELGEALALAKLGGGALAVVLLVLVLRWVAALVRTAFDRFLAGFDRLVAASERIPDSLAALREHVTDTAATNRHAMRGALQTVQENIVAHVSAEGDRTVYRVRARTERTDSPAPPRRAPSIPEITSDPPPRRG